MSLNNLSDVQISKNIKNQNTNEKLSYNLNNTNTQVKKQLVDTFGQSPAFPLVLLDENDLDSEIKKVHDYLLDVRCEAKKEHVIFYQKTDQNSGYKNDLLALKKKDDIIPKKHSIVLNINILKKHEIVKKFLSLKHLIDENKNFIIADEKTKIQFPTKMKEIRKFVFENNPPTISFFYNELDRRSIFKIFDYIRKWINKNINLRLLKWIWFFFLRINNTIDINECFCIRRLAIKIKNTFLQDDQETKPSFVFVKDVILTIVSEYYGQKDLLD